MELQVSVRSSDGTSIHDLPPMPVLLSSAREASLRCAAALHSVKASYLHAQLNDDSGEVLCDSGLVPLCSDDWVCLSSEPLGRGNATVSRLLSYTVEDASGWVLVFDMRERSDTVSVLTFVRVMKCTPSVAHDVAAKGDQVYESSVDGDVQPSDALDWEGNSTQSFVLRMFRKPAMAMLDPSFWNSMACGCISATGRLPEILEFLKLCDADLQTSHSELGVHGYSKLGRLPWIDIGISLTALSDTIERLRKHGFPPVFVFMYDETWLLLAHMFRVAAQVLKSEDVHMSLSVFAWALHSGEGSGKRVGSNFGEPHRDQAYDSCHTDEGSLSMLTTWIPLVPVTEHSGCMYAVPADCDPLLRCEDHPLYMRPGHDAVHSIGQPVPCEAGEVLSWRADLVHWGSSCSPGVEEPRKSISTMFMLPSCGMANTVTLEDLSKSGGWTLDVRLRTISRSLLQYQQWHPEFDGLPLGN